MAAKHIGNPPSLIGDRRPRIVVEARKALPRAFIWKIIVTDPKGAVSLKVSSEPQSWPTMEAAYIEGSKALGNK